ncbi:M36 family metallopeptidase, partial [Acidobacteriota bacterium]
MHLEILPAKVSIGDWLMVLNTPKGLRVLRMILFISVVVFASPFILKATQPIDELVLPDYDVRSESGILLERTQGGFVPSMGDDLKSALFGIASRPDRHQLDALERLESALGQPVIALWNPLSPAPASLRSRFGFLDALDGHSPILHARQFMVDHEDLFGLGPGLAATLVTARAAHDASSGMTIIEMAQKIGGMPVYGSSARFYYDGQGRLLQVNCTHLIPPATPASQIELSAADAIMSAAEYAEIELADPPEQLSPASAFPVVFDRGPFKREIYASPSLFPAGNAARPCWEVLLAVSDLPATYSVVVDARTGALLKRTNLTRYVQTEGRMFPSDPETDGPAGTITQFVDDAVNVSAYSPIGWSYSDQTIGNNTEVREDRTGDDDVTLGLAATGTTDPGPPPTVIFDFPFTNEYEASGAVGDLNAALVNVFFHVNAYHDYTYSFGFDEAGGNFQMDNFGLGGAGGDPVLADIQDSADLPPLTTTRNLSTFTTLPDGQPGRMELFLYSPPNARRDSAFDADIIYHELTHGMAERLAGGPARAGASSCLTGRYGCALAEGWSDFTADHVLDDSVFGQYVSGNAASGLRSSAVDANNYTLGDFCQINFIVPPGVCHCNNNGEIWTATLWDARTLLLGVDPAKAREITSRLMIDSMKLAPCSPTFLDVRDAMITADINNYAGAHYCLLWQAFSDRGMGFNAVITGVDDENPVEDFAM